MGVRTSESPFPEGSRRKACRHIPPYTFPQRTQPPSLVARLVLLRDLGRNCFTRGAITPPEKEPPVQCTLMLWKRKRVTVPSSVTFYGFSNEKGKRTRVKSTFFMSVDNNSICSCCFLWNIAACAGLWACAAFWCAGRGWQVL